MACFDRAVEFDPDPPPRTAARLPAVLATTMPVSPGFCCASRRTVGAARGSAAGLSARGRSIGCNLLLWAIG